MEGESTILKNQCLGTIKIKTDAKSLKKWMLIILGLFENINIKHYNILKSRIKTNWKLIENITAEVPNTASIIKDTLLHVSKFLEKMVFQIMFEIIKWIRQLQVRQQSRRSCICLILTRLSIYIYIYIYIWKYRGQVFLKIR